MDNVKIGPWTVENGPIQRVADVPKPAYDEPMTEPTRPELDARFKENEAKIATSEAKVDKRLAEFETTVNKGFSDIKTEFANLRSDFARMQTDGHKATIDLFKWGTALLVSLASVTVAIIVFIVNTALKAPAPVAAQRVISAQEIAPAAPAVAAPTAAPGSAKALPPQSR